MRKSTRGGSGATASFRNATRTPPWSAASAKQKKKWGKSGISLRSSTAHLASHLLHGSRFMIPRVLKNISAGQKSGSVPKKNSARSCAKKVRLRKKYPERPHFMVQKLTL